MKHIVIIGNGISGITAARTLRKLSDHRITVISEETEFFFSRTALMYVFMGHQRFEDTQPYENWFWGKNRIELMKCSIKTIDYDNKTLLTVDNKEIIYDDLILATGSKSNRFGWRGQDLDGVQGLYHRQDLENMARLAHTGVRRAVIIGGGLIGVEMAEMWRSRGVEVTFLVRETAFWNNVLPNDEARMIDAHLAEHHIDLRLETSLDYIEDNGKGGVSAVVTDKGERIEAQFVGLTVGVSPNIDFLKNTKLETNRGILVDEFLETNIKNVYAIGDCVELRKPTEGRRAIEAVWYTGRMMGETVAHTIAGKPISYRPRLWFNSAKFFDIEYQVYGDVPNNLPNHDTLDTIFWKSEDNKKAIRLVFERDSGAIRGFNLMGIRYRHEVCEKWILEKMPVEMVIKNLDKANFDPEFFKNYAPDFRKTLQKA
ncbi:MAG: hypothetical protein RL757_2198 [Bacteroidota bacterium]|jgi:NADPH-dependent 2,4-dienoyl-CoA reductase/sulfur reductase-like enzyme